MRKCQRFATSGMFITASSRSYGLNRPSGEKKFLILLRRLSRRGWAAAVNTLALASWSVSSKKKPRACPSPCWSARRTSSSRSACRFRHRTTGRVPATAGSPPVLSPLRRPRVTERRLGRGSVRGDHPPLPGRPGQIGAALRDAPASRSRERRRGGWRHEQHPPRRFKNHRGLRPNFPHVRVLVAAFIVSTAATLFLARRAGWDLLCFWNAGYVLTSWAAMTPAERRLARIRVRGADAHLRAAEIVRAHALRGR
jgi:hypothetical protein